MPINGGNAAFFVYIAWDRSYERMVSTKVSNMDGEGHRNSTGEKQLKTERRQI